MNRTVTCWVMAATALLASGLVQAHQIWFETSAAAGTVLYYGEYEKNMLEVTPGGLDRFQGLQARLGAEPLVLTLQRDHYVLARQPAAGDELVAMDPAYPLFEVAHKGSKVKAWWVPATRWAGRLQAVKPLPGLDLVPTGVVQGDMAEFQVTFDQAPLAGQAVVLASASGKTFDGVTDVHGKVRFALPWQGTYVLGSEHTVEQSGVRQSASSSAEPYALKRFNSTLSFNQTVGAPALSRASSQLPASEVARLAKQSAQ